MSGSRLWTPMLTRLKPAPSQARARSRVVLDGFASKVISAPGATSKEQRISAATEASSSGSMSDGVPPPTKIVSSRTPGSCRPSTRISSRSAATYSCSPAVPATDMKSQYSHLRSQNGMCT